VDDVKAVLVDVQSWFILLAYPPYELLVFWKKRFSLCYVWSRRSVLILSMWFKMMLKLWKMPSSQVQPKVFLSHSFLQHCSRSTQMGSLLWFFFFFIVFPVYHVIVQQQHCVLCVRLNYPVHRYERYQCEYSAYVCFDLVEYDISCSRLRKRVWKPTVKLNYSDNVNNETLLLALAY